MLIRWYSDTPRCRKRTRSKGFHCLCARSEIMGQWRPPGPIRKCCAECESSGVHTASEERLQHRTDQGVGQGRKGERRTSRDLSGFRKQRPGWALGLRYFEGWNRSVAE